jgi:hypothetical protein
MIRASILPYSAEKIPEIMRFFKGKLATVSLIGADFVSQNEKCLWIINQNVFAHGQ